MLSSLKKVKSQFKLSSNFSGVTYKCPDLHDFSYSSPYYLKKHRLRYSVYVSH